MKDKVSSEGGLLAWITLLAVAGFSPVPFKLLTITSGFVHFNLFLFITVSLITRGSRFFLIAFLIGRQGGGVRFGESDLLGILNALHNILRGEAKKAIIKFD